MHLKMCFIILLHVFLVYYYDYSYVFYMLDIGQRAFVLMFPVYHHTNENKDYLSMSKIKSETNKAKVVQTCQEKGRRACDKKNGGFSSTRKKMERKIENQVERLI